MERISEIRENNYFDTHSVEDLLKKYPQHKCIHRFELDDRLLPKPVNVDCYGQSRCDLCSKPFKSQSSDTLDLYSDKNIQTSEKNLSNYSLPTTYHEIKIPKPENTQLKSSNKSCSWTPYSSDLLSKNQIKSDTKSTQQTRSDITYELCNQYNIKPKSKSASRISSQQKNIYDSTNKIIHQCQENLKSKSSMGKELSKNSEKQVSSKDFSCHKSYSYERKNSLPHNITDKFISTTASTFPESISSEIPLKRNPICLHAIPSNARKNKEYEKNLHTLESTTKSSLASKNNFGLSQFELASDVKLTNNLGAKLSSSCRKINIGDGDKIIVLNTDIDDSRMSKTFFERCKKIKFRPKVVTTNTFALRYQKGVI